MSFPGPFLLVATLLCTAGAVAVTEARAAQPDAAHVAQLRAGAAKASSVGDAYLVLAQR